MSVEIEIDPNHIELPSQIRQENSKANEEEELRRLGESMKTEQIAAVGVVKHHTIKDWYKAVWGFRRIRAAVLVKKPTVRARLLDSGLDESQYRLLNAAENFLRADLTAFEKWKACVDLLQLNSSWSHKDLATHLHVDPGMITRILSASKLTSAWQAALQADLVGITDCYVASKVSEEEQGQLLAAKLAGASRDELERKAKKSKNGHSAEPKTKKVTIPYLGGTAVLTGTDLGMSEVADLLQGMVKEARKAVGVYDLSTFESIMRDKYGPKEPKTV
jgi:ParB/RepB/Spo0J family partition protein